MNRLAQIAQRLALVLLIGPSVASAHAVTGTVLDPHGLPVVGAQVTLSCTGHLTMVKTDSKGRFSFPDQVPNVGCRVVVVHKGFAMFEQNIEILRYLLVELTVKSVPVSITVLEETADSAAYNPVAFGSVSLSGAELETISDDTGELIRWVKLLAGTTLDRDNIYINGLPADRLPPARVIDRIAINQEPFSAEYSDSGGNHIEISEKVPDRQYRVYLDGLSFVATQSPMVPGLRSISRSASTGATGPIPKLPLIFSTDASFHHYRREKARAGGARSVTKNSLAVPSSVEDQGLINFASSAEFVGSPKACAHISN